MDINMMQINVNMMKEKAATTYYNNGCALLQLGKFQEAIVCLDQAIKLDPDHSTDVYNRKVEALSVLKKYQEAIVCYDKATTYINKGDAFYALGDYRQAIECYDKDIKLDRDDISSWNNKGVALHALDKYQEAIKCFNYAIKVDPNFPLAYCNRGQCYRLLGQHDLAIKDFKTTSKLLNEGKTFSLSEHHITYMNNAIKDLVMLEKELASAIELANQVHSKHVVFN